MKIVKIILFSLMLPAAVFAQKTAADSLYIYSQDRQVLDFAKQNGTQLISSGIEKLSTVNLTYERADGHFRTSQQAENGWNATFGTSGIATVGRFKLFGDFKFSRMRQDSMAWTMKGVEDNVNPYYFAAGKAGPYERINYDIKALGTYSLIGEKLYVASGLNYFYNTTARSIDPRASVQTFKLLLTPELIYKIGNHTLGLPILWGYEHEENNISYKNINYSGGQAYPDRITYLVFGYGNFAQAGNRALRRKGDYIGTGINYAFVNKTKSLRAKLSYQEYDEDISYPLASSTRYERYGTFYLKKYDLILLAGINSNNYRQQLSTKVSYIDGKDQNKTLNASSYKYRATSAILGYNIQSNKASSVNTELGVNVLYYDQSQRDLSVSHTFNFAYVQPSLQAGIYKKYRNTSRLKLTVSPGMRLPVGSTLTIPSGELNQVFNNNISYPDYAYYSSTVGVLSSAAEYITPRLFDGVYSSISISSSYYKPFNTKTINPAAAFKPSGSFLNAAFSFNIYF